MYKHILIPTDGSDLSEMAVKQGIAFAKSLNAKATAIAVSPTYHAVTLDPVMVTDTPDQYRRHSEEWAERSLAVARDAAKSASVSCEAMHVVNDHPWKAIISAAAAKGCDLIFMASHGRRGVSALVLGSETTKVLTHSKIPVLVCR